MQNASLPISLSLSLSLPLSRCETLAGPEFPKISKVLGFNCLEEEEEKKSIFIVFESKRRL